MRMPNTTAAGYFLILASLFGGWAAVPASASAELLTEEMLKRYIPGAQINLDTPLGSVVPVKYDEDGSLKGKAGAVAFFLGSQTDNGKWWISGSRLCQQWKTWFNGQKSCVKVYRHDENRIAWIDQDGDKGTGTIVALRETEPAPPPSSQQPVRPQTTQQQRPVPSTATNTAPQAINSVSKSNDSVSPKKVAAGNPRPRLSPKKAPAPSRVAAAPVAKPAPPPPMPAKNPGQRLLLAATAGRYPEPGKAGAAKLPVASAFRVINVPQDDVLNVRSGPDPTTNIVGVIPPRGSGIMKLGGCAGDWCPIRYEREQGWVHRYFIAPENEVRSRARSNPNPITYRVVRVAANDVLNLRRRPDPDARIIGRIPSSGRRIHLTGYCVGEWCPVTHGRARGWAHRHYLALEY